MARKPAQSPSEVTEDTAEVEVPATEETTTTTEPKRTETEDGFVVLDY